MQSTLRRLRPLRRHPASLATGPLLGVAAYLAGSLLVYGLARLAPDVPIGPGDAAVGYGYAHPFVRSTVGTAAIPAEPLVEVVIVLGLVAGPLLLAGGLQARASVRPDDPDPARAATFGATVAVGYAVAALAVATTLELSGNLSLGSVRSATALDPASATVSALAVGLLFGAIGGAAATERRRAAAVGAVPALTFLALVALVLLG